MGTDTKLGTLGPALRLPVARIVATEKMPYFSEGIENLVPYETPGSKKICVTDGSVLCYDPEVFAGLTGLEAGTLILHEYMHVFSKHGPRFQELVRRGVAELTQEDHELANQAADAEINDNLRDAGLPVETLKINGQTGVMPKKLGLKDHQTFEQYFAQLKDKQRQENQGGGGGKGKGPGSGPQSPGCGSGAGNPQPEEPPSAEAKKLGRDPVEQDITRKAAAERILERQKSRGDVPAGLLAQAEGMIPKSDIPWEDRLRSQASAAVAFLQGAGDYTFEVRSPFQSALEELYGEDAPVLPGEHCPIAKVDVVFDTSGSVSDDDLLRMVGHTMGVIDTLGGMSVRFLACDAAVHAMVECRTAKELLANLKGRGGTDFRPAFKKIDESREKPDVIIFQTDGYGPAPEKAPSYAKTIWVITPGGTAPAAWGEAIYMDTEQAKREAGQKRRGTCQYDSGDDAGDDDDDS